MNVRARARLVNDPDSASLAPSTHARTRCIPLSHAPRASCTPASRIDVAVARCRHVAAERARESRRWDRERNWLEKALMKVACCLHKSPRQRRKSLSHGPPAYPLHPLSRDARSFMWWLVLMVLRVYLLLLEAKSSPWKERMINGGIPRETGIKI